MKRYSFLLKVILVLFLVDCHSVFAQIMPFQIYNATPEYSDTQIYVALVGQNNGTNVWLDCKTGQSHIMSSSDNTILGPNGIGYFANCFTRLDNIPSKTIQVPMLTGGKIYVSFVNPLYFSFFSNGYISPDITNQNDPNNGIRFEVIDFDWSAGGLTTHLNRDESYQFPIGIEAWGNNAQYQKRGEILSHQDILSKFQQTVSSKFQDCYQTISNGAILLNPAKVPSFQSNGSNGNLFQSYIDDIWTQYSSGQNIPGTIEAENYDSGGQNLSYSDVDGNIHNNVYRFDDVDLEANTNGYNIGYISHGEWVEYTIGAVNAGVYDINLSLASNNSVTAKSVEVKLNGILLGSVTPINTGGWQTWQNYTLNNISIAGGSNQVLRLNFGGGEFNFDKITFTPSGVLPPLFVFNSYDVVMQSGSPQATITNNGVIANLEFYESTNDGGVDKGVLFSNYTAGSHADAFNNAQNVWASGAYPYVAKSSKLRGVDVNETNVPSPLSVSDLQMHPPSNNHLTVSSFIAPASGIYTISNLAVRRVYNDGASVALRVFDKDKTQIAEVVATSRAWVSSPTSTSLNLLKDDRIYFAVANVDGFSYDAAETSWTLTLNTSGNMNPVANAGANQYVTDSDKNGSETVTLNGSGSSDPDGTIASYSWSEAGKTIASGANPSVTFALGNHTVILTVTDNKGATATSSVTIAVSDGSIVPTNKFYMSSYVPITITKPSNVDFNTVMNSNGYVFPKAFSASTITALNAWANQVLSTNPFEGMAANQVPFINFGDNVNKDKMYAFITQEQMAYLYLISIFGNGTYPLNNGAVDGLSYIRKYNDGKANYFMFSAMCLLTEIMKTPDYKSTYIGIAFGGLNQEQGMDYIMNNNLLAKSMGALNVGYFDESLIMVKDATSPMLPEWCKAETQFNTIDDFWALNKTTADLGSSFHSVDIPGQTIVDIGGLCYGGGVAAPGAHVANSQDETLPLFFPETLVWSFFKATAATEPFAKLSYDKGIMFFGVRRYVHGFNGSKRVVGPAAGNPMEPARSFLTDKVVFNLKGSTLSMYDHNMVFTASQMNGADLVAGYWKKERKLYTQGSSFTQNKWNNLLNLDSRNGLWSSPLADIGKWYGTFAPHAYNADLGDVFAKSVRRIGTFNWGAGVWWGDAQQYFLISWLGTSMLSNVTLDYYIFSTSIENEGVQCSLLKGDLMTRAVTRNSNSICPGQFKPPYSPTKDVVDVYNILKPLTASSALDKLKAASFQDVFVFDGIK